MGQGKMLLVIPMTGAKQVTESLSQGDAMSIVIGTMGLGLIGIFTYLLLRNRIPIKKYLAMSGVWMFFVIVFLMGPETVSEIGIGILKVKRDVEAAREIRNRVEELAQEIQSSSDRIVGAQTRIDAQQKDISEANAKIKAAEQNVEQTAGNLRGAVKLVVDASYLEISSRGWQPIPKPVLERISQDLLTLTYFAMPSEIDRGKWLEEVKGILKRSGIPVKEGN